MNLKISLCLIICIGVGLRNCYGENFSNKNIFFDGGPCPCCKLIAKVSNKMLNEQNGHIRYDTSSFYLHVFFQIDSTNNLKYISNATDSIDVIFLKKFMDNPKIQNCLKNNFESFPVYYFYKIKENYYYFDIMKPTSN